MRVTPHNCASALSTAVSLHLSACIPNFLTLEIYPYFSEAKGYVQVLENSPEDRIKDGFLALDNEPGYGVRLAHERLGPWLFAELK